ncbi:MAG: LytTR family DNA-binding domain-containing protein [Coriobacteriia bacterium]|nr:LytTR family DNA-binding domain-containing protein [Coriobacteriia bacterium]
MIRALVIDDEMPARSELCFLLEDFNDVKVVGEADNVRDAVALIKQIPTDVVFLDINMPGVSGIQLAEGLKTHPAPPAIVFVTAYTQYAVKAFELSALDYLVKPVETKRLAQALEKVRQRMRADKAAAAPAPQNEPVTTNRLMVDRAGKKQFLTISDVLFAMAKDDYTYLFTAEDRFISSTSLARIEAQLEGQGFFRAHRRYLINLHKVDTLESQPGGTLTLTLVGNSETIPVSRRRAASLKTALRSL